MKFIRKYWEILIILVLGLTPLLWYKDSNSLALGHDMGFPINPIVFFQDRLFLWTDRIGLGWDQTLGSAATLIHGLEALVASTGLPIFEVQKIIFIFWFLLPGLAMYYFVSTIHKERDQWFIRLSASLFYMFNHFLLQAWFIAERTKISLFIALPILLGLTISMIEGRISRVKGLALMSLVFFLFNGGGGFPLYGGLLLALFTAFAFFGFINLRRNFKVELKRLIGIALGILASFILANFYWVLPLLISVLSSYAQSLSSIGGISGVIAWSFEISKFASILNVMRLQGIPDWYDNPTHPFSKLFLDNPVLILISFLIPVIVFSSIFLIRKAPEFKKYIIFFNILAVLGIIFTAGSHPPFGAIYNLFLTFIPGFAIFRTPFYKFAPAVWFAYSYLFAFSFYYLTQNFKNIRSVLRFLILPLILIYSFPFFTGSFFNWRESFSTMTNLPAYVLSFSNYANSNLSFNDRILTFPNQNLDWNSAIYKWGYWSTSPVESLSTNKSIITNDREMTESGRKLTEVIYKSIIDGTDDWEKAVEILGINYFLLHNDFYFNAPGFKTEDPKTYRERFLELGFEKKEVFGEWELYKIPEISLKNKLYIENDAVGISTNENILEDQYFGIENVIDLPLGNDSFVVNSPEITDGLKTMVLLQNCLFCDKEQKETPIFLPRTRILPGSVLYPLVKYKEKKQRNKLAKNINSKLDFHLGITLKRLAEIKHLIDLGADESKTNSAVDQLKKELILLQDSVNKMNKKRGDMRLLVLRIDSFLREENRILADISNDANDSTRNKLTDVRSFIALSTQQNRKYESLPPENNEKRYHLTIDKKGGYEILVRKDEFKPDLVVEKAVFDNKTLPLKTLNKNEHYYSFGELFFNKGFHEISLFLRNPENLLKGNDENLDFDINPLSPDCRTFKIKPLPSKIYILNFDYLTERSAKADNGPFVKVEQILEDDVKDDDFQLKANNILQTFDYKIATEKDVQSINVSVCASPGYENSSNIRIKNLSLRPFLTPALAFVSTDKNLTINDNKILATQINPTKYEVKVNANSPYILVLNNKFNSNWKISDKDANAKHFMINGFANAWNISKTGEYSLIIEYNPQKYFYIGWLVTITFMTGVVIYLTYAIYKHK